MLLKLMNDNNQYQGKVVSTDLESNRAIVLCVCDEGMADFIIAAESVCVAEGGTQEVDMAREDLLEIYGQHIVSDSDWGERAGNED